MEIKIVRSHRRLRTVSARMVNDCLVVSAPLTLSENHLEEIVSGFKLKFEKKRIKDELNKNQPLSEVAGILNEKYFNNQLKINSIEYVSGQNSKYGCCNYRTGCISVSHKVGLMPAWVRDYVLIHEMAHLVVPNHSKAFWDIVYRYKLTERARGYLMAAGVNMEEQQEEST
ncbi:MAG: M48 family metallopeptidase [Candidatus Omnitrophota bacterium]